MADNNIITVIHPNDVLFGRGSGPNDHEGNINFRETVSAHKAEYMATNHRQTKAKIARGIVDTVLAKNGRFLRKIEAADAQNMGLPNGMDAYIAVSDDTIMEKAKQALRQNREKKDDPPPAAAESCSLAAATASPPEPPRQPDLAYSEYYVQDAEPAPSLAQQQQQQQQPQMAAYHMPEMMVAKPLDNYEQDEAQFTTYTTELADPDEDTRGPSRRSSIARTMDYGYGAGGSRRGSLLGGRRDSMQSRRDSAMSTTGSRRDSLSMAEVWRRDSMLGTKGGSMQMSGLMESFQGMGTAEFNSSSDTIGTIDPMQVGVNYVSGLSNMSGMSMQSVTSLFRTSSDGSFKSGDPSHEQQAGPFRGRSGSHDMNGSSDLNWVSVAGVNSLGAMNDSNLGAMDPPAQTNTRASINPNDLWNSRQIASLMTDPLESISGEIGRHEHSLGSSDLSSMMSASTRSALLSSMNTQSLFDINKSVSGESGQILPPERK
jgi:hypothetical protein